MAMFGTHLSPSTLIAKKWIANEYVATDLIFIGRRDDEWVEGYKPHVMQMEMLKDIIASAISFTDLYDTPDALGTPGQILQVNATGDMLEFVDPINEFLDLLDTPNDYTGFAGYSLIVNLAEDGIIFQAPEVKPEIYEARVNFIPLVDPTLAVLHINQLLVTVTLERMSVGVYRANFSSAVNANKLSAYINNSDTGMFHITAYNNLYVEFTHKDFAGIIVDADFIVSVEIKLYP